MWHFTIYEICIENVCIKETTTGKFQERNSLEESDISRFSGLVH